MLRFTRIFIGMNPPVVPTKSVPPLRQVRNDPGKPRINRTGMEMKLQKPVKES
jgi:hypothetical protein